MITFYITTRFWEGQDVELVDYTCLTEKGIADMINKNPNGLVYIAPSPIQCVFREKFIEPFLDENGYIREGVYSTKLNDGAISFRLIENINGTLSRKK